MITIYKKKAIKNMELVALNDVYFNKYTSDMLDEKAANIIKKIDCSEMLDKYTIRSRFNGNVLNIDKLSTGCKTVLNIMYNPDKVFDICECGDNAKVMCIAIIRLFPLIWKRLMFVIKAAFTK